MSKVAETFAAFDDAVAKDKVFECERLADEIEKLASKDATARKEMEKRSKTLGKVRRDVELLSKLLKEIKSDDGWTFATKKKGVTIHFKQPEGSPFIMTKARKIITPLPGKKLSDTFVALCSLFAETDLMPKWFPRGLMQSHDTLLEESAFSRFTRIKIAMPALVPISNREAVIHGKGYDMTERSAMAISFKSLSQDFEHEDFSVPEPTKKYTRIDIEGAYYIEMLEDGTVQFDQIQLLDLKLKMVPPFILNALSKGQLPLEFNNNLMKCLHKFDGSEWESRVTSNPHLYMDIKKRLEDYLASRGTSDEALQERNAALQDADGEEGSGKDSIEEGSFLGYLRSFLGYFVEEQKAQEIVEGIAAKWHGHEHEEKNPAEEPKRHSFRLSFKRKSAQRANHPAVEALKEQETEAAKPRRSLSKTLSRVVSVRRRRKPKAE